MLDRGVGSMRVNLLAGGAGAPWVASVEIDLAATTQTVPF